jgi:hypothetical protein
MTSTRLDQEESDWADVSTRKQPAAGQGTQGNGHSKPVQDCVAVDDRADAQSTPVRVYHTSRYVSNRKAQHLQQPTSSKSDKARRPSGAVVQHSNSCDQKGLVCNYDIRRAGNGSQDGVKKPYYGHSSPKEEIPVIGVEPASAHLTPPEGGNLFATPTVTSGNSDKNLVTQITSSPELRSAGSGGQGRWSRSMRRGSSPRAVGSPVSAVFLPSTCQR